MSTVLRQDTFECYQYYKQPSSLGKSLIKWMAIHILLLIFYLPLSIILFISLFISIFCINETSMPQNGINEKNVGLIVGASIQNNKDDKQNSSKCCRKCKCQRIKLLFHPGVIYLFTASLLLILYIINIFYDVIHHLHIEEFFTLTPYVLFILFKDAVVYSLNMRKALLTALRIFGDNPFCQCYVNIFKWILKNYWIWGVKINPISKNTEPKSSINGHHIDSKKSMISGYIALDFKQVPICYNLCKLHRIYSSDEYGLFLISVVAGIGFIFLSFGYYIYQYHESSGDVIELWILFGVGIFFKIFTVLCVARFIELIFQGFQIYYNHMTDLSEEIEFHHKIYNDKDINGHYNSLKNDLKRYDVIKKKKNYNINLNGYDIDQESISRRTSLFIQSVHDGIPTENEQEEQKYNKDDNNNNNNNKVIDLSLNDEWAKWFENWCRIETLSSLYFHNRQNIIFGIIFSTLIAVTVTFYQIFIWNTLIDELNLSCFCGLLYVLIVVLRFIIWSFKFSKLETKHVRLIRKQKMYINHKKILLYKEQKNLNNKPSISSSIPLRRDEYIQNQVGEYDAICKYLEDATKHIQDRSLCPKIAGLTLNKAFVNLTITSILGYGFAWILYKLRSDYINQN